MDVIILTVELISIIICHGFNFIRLAKPARTGRNCLCLFFNPEYKGIRHIHADTA